MYLRIHIGLSLSHTPSCVRSAIEYECEIWFIFRFYKNLLMLTTLLLSPHSKVRTNQHVCLDNLQVSGITFLSNEGEFRFLLRGPLGWTTEDLVELRFRFGERSFLLARSDEKGKTGLLIVENVHVNHQKSGINDPRESNRQHLLDHRTIYCLQRIFYDTY